MRDFARGRDYRFALRARDILTSSLVRPSRLQSVLSASLRRSDVIQVDI